MGHSYFKKLRDALLSSRLRISIPFLAYEIDVSRLLDTQSIDERLQRLSLVKNDLQVAVQAIRELEKEAEERKEEAELLERAVRDLEQEKSAAEAILDLPREAVARLMQEAASKGRVRGLLEGFLTGVLSSLLVWLLTNWNQVMRWIS